MSARENIIRVIPALACIAFVSGCETAEGHPIISKIPPNNGVRIEIPVDGSPIGQKIVGLKNGSVKGPGNQYTFADLAPTSNGISLECTQGARNSINPIGRGNFEVYTYNVRPGYSPAIGLAGDEGRNIYAAEYCSDERFADLVMQLDALTPPLPSRPKSNGQK